MWLVGVGGIYGCGCMEIYRFPHILLIPTPLVSILFCSSIPLFFLVFRSFYLFLCTVLKIVDVEKNVTKFFSEHRFNQHSIDKQT